MKNPGFLIVCVMIAAAPLFRGSVHAWAQTVIQAMVALGGIVLYKQVRLGQNGRKFDLYKFRTMVPDAEERL